MKHHAINTKLFFNKFVLVFIFLITTGLILSPGLSGPFIYDDHKNLGPLMGDEANYKAAIFENNAGPFGRSLTMATFVVNHWLSGGLVLFELKLTSLFIHLLNGFLVYYLVYILLKTKLSINKAAVYAVFVMGFWVLSPVNTGVVFYVIQRATLLAMTFMLITCITYVRMRLTCKKLNFRSLLFMLLIFISWALALISKENAVLLPLIILCIEICFFDTLDLNRINKKTMVSSLFIFGILLLLIFLYFINSLSFLDYSNRGFSLAERLYTQPVVLLVYLQEILFPHTVDVSLYRSDDFKLRETFWNLATINSLIIIATLLLVSLINLRNTKYKYISAGVLIYFSGHLLESSIFPLELFFRHRNYFPSFGLYLSLILLVDKGITTSNARQLMCFVAIAYFGFLGQHSYAQAKVWSSYDLILLNAYKNHPEAMGGNLVIVGELVKKRDLLSSLSISHSIISARPVKSLPLKIQRFYVYCELANDIPQQEYEILERDLNLINPKLISLSLDNFLQSYTNKQCDFINIRRIIDSFTSWSNAQLSLGTETSMELWTIDYYMVELLLLLGEREEAIKRLDLHVSYGNPKALYFKENAL